MQGLGSQSQASGRRALQSSAGQLIGAESSERLGNLSFFCPKMQGILVGGRAGTELGKTGAPSIFLPHCFSLARQLSVLQACLHGGEGLEKPETGKLVPARPPRISPLGLKKCTGESRESWSLLEAAHLTLSQFSTLMGSLY